MFYSHRRAVLGEIRERIGVLLRDTRFRLACRYTSPALEADIRSTGVPDDDDLTALERGLYSYAARFISKANPFHLFAEVSFPTSIGLRPAARHETVLDLSFLLKLESRLLPHAGDSGRTWMQLAPFRRSDKTLQFWITTHAGLRLIPVETDDRLELVVSFFRNRRDLTRKPVGTRHQLREFLRSADSPETDDGMAALLTELVRAGIVREYVVTDPWSFDRDLEGLHPPSDPDVRALARHHLAMRSTRELPEVHDELAEIAGRVGWDPDHPPPFFVNTYRTLETASLDSLLPPIVAQLTELKPAFGPFHNFRDHARVLGAYTLDLLAHKETSRIPFLVLLRHYLRHRREVVARYVESTSSGREAQSLQRTRSILSASDGTLSSAHLRALFQRILTDETPGRLCFVGPFDPHEAVFYVTNVFAGHGRYLRRYLLDHRRASAAEGRARCDGLDVELVVPPPPNLNYVRRTFATGCGFQARWAHRYDRWIGPEEILVERRASSVGYRWKNGETPLRIRYCGLQLSQHLPPEYHLLLLDQADSFDNPFVRNPSSAETDEVVHTPELRYGHVCLRRQSWSVRRDLLSPLLAEPDPLRFAVRLRSELRGHFDSGSEHWYYSAPGLGRRSHKPRFLDLRNPLSAHAFRRTLGSMEKSGWISFSEMRPGPDQLLKTGSDRHVTELMLEV